MPGRRSDTVICELPERRRRLNAGTARKGRVVTRLPLVLRIDDVGPTLRGDSPGTATAGTGPAFEQGLVTRATHVLALNPVDDNDVTKYRITDRRDRQLMLSVALHEVAHVAVDGHDDEFAGVLTGLIGALDPAATGRAMRAAT